MEKNLFQRLSHFLNSNAVITLSQYGFRSAMSTETALLNQKEYILGNIENKNLSRGVFVEYSKAFDRINHTTLLKKLFLMVLETLFWT